MEGIGILGAEWEWEREAKEYTAANVRVKIIFRRTITFSRFRCLKPGARPRPEAFRFETLP